MDAGLQPSARSRSKKPDLTVWYPDSRVRIWDTATGTERHTLTMPAQEIRAGMRTGFHDLCFAPAGTTLVTGGLDRKLRVWDAATGKERRQFGGFAVAPRAFAFAPDGRTLALADGNSTIRLIDLASGDDRLPLHGHRTEVGSVIFTPDSRTVVTAGWDGTLYFWDPATGLQRQRRTIPVPGGSRLELLPGGTRYLAAGADGVLRTHQLDTGKELHAFPWHDRDRDFVLAPDGRTFAEASPDGKDIRLLRADTGQELHTLKGAEPFAGGFAFTADGRTLFAWDQDRTVTAWDLATGRRLRRLPGPATPRPRGGQPYFTARLSPDAKLLAFCLQEPVLPVVDTATGQEFRRITVAADGVSALAFSPDGKSVAWGGWRDGTVYLGELATGRERHRFTGHRGRVLALAFSADGRSLISGTQDTTALVWDLTGQLTTGEPGRGRLAPSALADHWTTLADQDAAAAFNAMRVLAADPADAVPFVAERLHPVAGVEQGRLNRLVAELGSDAFAVREQATRELEQLGEAALHSLQEALAGKPMPEARRRLQRLIEKQEQEDWLPSPERLRTLRALEVLEWAGTPEAQRVLEALARGAPGARLTRDAQAAALRVLRRTTGSR